MQFVLSILLDLSYLLLLILVTPWALSRRLRHGKYRFGWSEKLLGRLPVRRESTTCRVWLHAVSVGEVMQLKSVIRSLRPQRPDIEFILTTTTETGFSVARERYPDCEVAFYPLDFSWTVRNALQRVRPDMIVLVELELWPNFIRSAHNMGIPVVLINGRLSERSYSGYRWLRPLLQRLLNSLAFVAVQTIEYRDRFLALGCRPEKLCVTGSLKFDSAQLTTDAVKITELRQFFLIDKDELVWIAGSTQSPEETMVLETYSQIVKTMPSCRLILAPRHPERGDEIARMIRDQSFGVIRRSTGEYQSGPTGISVGLLDTVGELSDCWGLADIGFVGGSFGDRGGQNMIEPAAFAVPTCFGPNTKNFRDVVQLLTSIDAAKTVDSRTDLEEFILDRLTNRNDARQMGERARDLVRSQQGANAKTCNLILSVLDRRGENSLGKVA